MSTPAGWMRMLTSSSKLASCLVVKARSLKMTAATASLLGASEEASMARRYFQCRASDFSVSRCTLVRLWRYLANAGLERGRRRSEQSLLSGGSDIAGSFTCLMWS